MRLFGNKTNNDPSLYSLKARARVEKRLDLLSPNSGLKIKRYDQTRQSIIICKIIYSVLILSASAVMVIAMTTDLQLNSFFWSSLPSALCFVSLLYLLVLLFQQITVKSEMTSLKYSFARVQFMVFSFLCAFFSLVSSLACFISLFINDSNEIKEYLGAASMMVCTLLFTAVFIIEKRRKIEYIVNEQHYD